MRERRSVKNGNLNHEIPQGRLLSPLARSVIEDDNRSTSPTQNSRRYFRVSLPLRRHQVEESTMKSSSNRHIYSNDTQTHSQRSNSMTEGSPFIKSERQIENLNPLKLQQPSQAKPLLSLVTTSLARPDHRNVFRLNATEFEKPKKEPVIPALPPTPAYINGGPVDPAQLILLNSGAKPVAPGRPPSNVVAQPSAVNPETFLTLTETPALEETLAVHSTISPQVQTTQFVRDVPQEEELGLSPFFSGRPDQPNYIYTTARIPITPVNPANFLIASGHTTLPPITVPPPGFNPLLNILQKLDKVEYNENSKDKNSVVIPEPTLFQDFNHGFPTSLKPAMSVKSSQISSSLSDLDYSNTSVFPRIQNIPGAVPVASLSDKPLIVSNNTVIGSHHLIPILNYIHNNSNATFLEELVKQLSANQNSASPTGNSPGNHDTFADDNAHRNSEVNSSTGISNIRFPPLNSVHNHHQLHPQTPNFISVPQNSENFQFPFNSNSENHSFNMRPGSHQQAQFQGPFSPPGSAFPFHSSSFPSYPANSNHFGSNSHVSPVSHPSFHPYPGNINPPPGPFGFDRLSYPSASVSSSVQNEKAAANSTAEGAEDFISTSTTIVKGGTSTSNNNFFRVRPQNVLEPNTFASPPLGNNFPYDPYFRPRPESQLSPLTRIPSPVNIQSLPNVANDQEMTPRIIVDGLHNKTALPSDVFPGSQINVACSKKHGCPTFILRSRPSAPQPSEKLENVFVIDEAIEERPKGNINIQCDYEAGCPTYIINTTPSPEPTSLATEKPNTVVESVSDEIPENSTPDYEEVVQAIDTIIAFLNQSSINRTENNHQGLTGIFDNLSNAENTGGLASILSNLPAPDINPQNIRPKLQIIPISSPATTPNPLLQQSLKRPSYDVLQVPKNTVLRYPSFPDILDNRRHFQVNPILDSAQNTASKLLGQPDSTDLLKDSLLQAHLSALQSSDAGTLPLEALLGFVPHKGSLGDTHMGSIEVTEPPPLAAILNLEPLNIPNEPPLVPTDSSPSRRDDHHDSMMRRIMGAALVGLPITTALLGALGAPVAVMAPIGLALPALLTMGFMDTDGGVVGLLRHSHGHHNHHHHHHGRHHTRSTQENSPANSFDAGGRDIPSEREDTTLYSDASETAGDLAPQRSPPTLSDGGGIGGAISRLAGVIPLLASSLSSQIGNIRRRRSAEIQPDASFPALQQHHLKAIETLNHYYTSLTNGSKGARPSPEDIKMHRKYLLNLLQMLRRPAAGDAGLENGVRPGTSEAFGSPSSGGFPPDEGEGGGVTATSEGLDEPLADLVEPSDSGAGIRFASRTGEVSSDSADIQTIGVEEAALLLHQFQTQGHVNLLPPGFPGQSPPSAQQQQQQQQQATATTRWDSKMIHDANQFRVNISLYHPSQKARRKVYFVEGFLTLSPPQPASSPLEALAPPKLSNMEHQPRPEFGSQDDQNDVRLALLQAVLANRIRLGSPTRPAPDENPGPSVILGDPSPFSDYEALTSTILNGTRDGLPPDVVMVNSFDFQEIQQPETLSSAFLPLNTTGNRLDVVPATFQNTRITTELTTALTNFINNIADAITQLITDLQAAINANPAVALLLLLPLLLLPFLFNKFHGGGGYGGGGYGHRRVFYQPPNYSRSVIAEQLARKILKDIDEYERLFMSEEDYYADRSGAVS
ncbi:LOW QUALITY PROTEIN: uncharacterized protein LOC135209350 [Macrobrachium nipponense]|uniref:LOW QUALITY PROTEIN: uncharacterized protein LOC135209350 n=1 Tax=Macrobrachium nipponense TaxID=159736 RepID=UPI0030C7C61F